MVALGIDGIMRRVVHTILLKSRFLGEITALMLKFQCNPLGT